MDEAKPCTEAQAGAKPLSHSPFPSEEELAPPPPTVQEDASPALEDEGLRELGLGLTRRLEDELVGPAARREVDVDLDLEPSSARPALPARRWRGRLVVVAADMAAGVWGRWLQRQQKHSRHGLVHPGTERPQLWTGRNH